MTDASLDRTPRPTRLTGRRLPARSVLAAAAVAWLGFLVHNVADLPNQTLLSPETLWPGLVTLTLLVLYATGPAPVAGVALFGWALMNLAGGALSVLPLSVLPFQPEKTVRDYSFHLLYAATQVPLLVVAYQLAVATPSAPAREAARGGSAVETRATQPPCTNGCRIDVARAGVRLPPALLRTSRCWMRDPCGRTLCARPPEVGPEERRPGMWMWVWILAIAAVLVLAARMLDRRGSTGASRADDLPGMEHPRLDRSHGYATNADGGGGDGGW